MTSRDCKHGHLARSCELCDMERQITELRSIVRGLLACHPTRDDGVPQCGYVVAAREALR